MKAGRRTAWPSGRRLRTTLDQIEKTLVAEDPGLGSAFGTFTRLTCDEAMPGTEQALAKRTLSRPWSPHRRARKLIIAIGLIACLGAPVSILLAHAPSTCSGLSGHRQSTIQAASCRPAPVRP